MTDVDVNQGVMPSATTSTVKVVGDIAEGMKSAITGVVKWAEKKADDLGKENEGGVGPYASPATCIPNELDPLSSGVMPAMEAETSKEKHAKEEQQDKASGEPKK